LDGTPFSLPDSWYRDLVIGPLARSAQRTEGRELAEGISRAVRDGALKELDPTLRSALEHVAKVFVRRAKEGRCSPPELAVVRNALSAADSTLVSDDLKSVKVEPKVAVPAAADEVADEADDAGEEVPKPRGKTPAKKAAPVVKGKKNAAKPAAKSPAKAKAAAKGKKSKK
jgi:hypothetical protein